MSFQSTTGDFESKLQGILPADCLPTLSTNYLEEPRGRWQATGGVLVTPRSTQQVADIVRLCRQENMAIVPYGGGTGLVGGQIMEGDIVPVILSMEKMNQIRFVHPDENVLVADAGCILADVQTAAADVDRLFPLSLASEGTARIGGLLSTNAGGVNVLRYGNARDQVLGLEAVLPNGEIWNGLSRLRKDNTGYDLRHLMMGAEGTLGVITGASLRLSPIPAVSGTAVMVVGNPRAALSLLSLARSQFGEGVSAFEFMHKAGFEFLRETLSDVRLPFAQDPEWTVLIEVGLAQGLDAATALENLFEDGVEQGLVSDGLIAQSKRQRADFWSVREHIPEANRKIGSVSSHDISLPLSAVPDFIVAANEKIAALGPFRVNCFGHLGDGNLHYNVFPDPGKSRADYMNERDLIKSTVHDLVHAMGGSVSAEHGIGRLKVGDLEKYGDPVRYAAMKAIKAALDPNGIMNPGVIFAP